MIDIFLLRLDCNECVCGAGFFSFFFTLASNFINHSFFLLGDWHFANLIFWTFLFFQIFCYYFFHQDVFLGLY